MAHASTHQANRIVKNAAETVGIQGILYVDSNGVERKKATAHTLRHSSPFVISKEGGRRNIRDLMGYTPPETTTQYLQFREEIKTPLGRSPLKLSESFSASKTAVRNTGNALSVALGGGLVVSQVTKFRIFIEANSTHVLISVDNSSRNQHSAHVNGHRLWDRRRNHNGDRSADRLVEPGAPGRHDVHLPTIEVCDRRSETRTFPDHLPTDFTFFSRLRVEAVLVSFRLG
jgi:hypothetical protein